MLVDRLLGPAAVLLLLAGSAGAEDGPTFEDLARQFESDVGGLITTYCHDCHSGDEPEAEIDLESFHNLADVRQRLDVWLKVREMLETGQMPPKDASQPTAEDLGRLQSWVVQYLKLEARASAGDPGPVVLRRLNKAEYAFTLADLTGVPGLDPTADFPVDSGAGEGFTNTGSALVMSPSLFAKYLDAAKETAGHAVLLPDGFRFSAGTTRRDWTDEIVAQIKALYGRTCDGNGRIPLEKYLAATLAQREALPAERTSIDRVAREHGLNARYLEALWTLFNGSEPSLLIDSLRAEWRTAAADDAGRLAGRIATWQESLWKFNTVGHMLHPWQEARSPLADGYETRLEFAEQAQPGTEVRLYLTAGDAGDGSAGDAAVWVRPRLVFPGRPDLPLRDVRGLTARLAERRERVFSSTAACLAAAAEIGAGKAPESIEALARRHAVDGDILSSWLDYLGLGTGGPVAVEGHLTQRLENTAGYAFVQGWGSPETPSLVANSSDQHVRIPGNMKPHGVCVHPSPTLAVAAGWRSPVAATLRIEGQVRHAHPECGNGVTWSLELRRGSTRQRLGTGVAQGGNPVDIPPVQGLRVAEGDLISLLIGPRDSNHACDLTDVELRLLPSDPGAGRWDLAADVSPDVLAGNPHADRMGNEGVWHFYAEPVAGPPGQVIPAGSLLARWQSAERAEEKERLAIEVQSLLQVGPPAAPESPDAVLYRQLASLGGPLFVRSDRPGAAPDNAPTEPLASEWGLDPGLFGKRSDGRPIDENNLSVQAGSVIEIRLPADLVAGAAFATSGTLDPEAGREGSMQLSVFRDRPPALLPLLPGVPIQVGEGTEARARFEGAFAEFRRWFPAGFCYAPVVPVDEVVTLALFHREDEPLVRLMLDEADQARIDRLWDELHYVSQDALVLVNAYTHLMEYATQDSDPRKFEHLRTPIREGAEAFQVRLGETEPAHVEALVKFASQAWRRPLAEGEGPALVHLYQRLRAEGLTHEAAFRLTLARVLAAPDFLYRIEKPAPGTAAAPVSDWELASRLSFFLWSSQPDLELRRSAETGRVREPEELLRQTRRMLADPRVRRLASQFAAQWLQVYGFDELNEKSDRHFPEFAGLRAFMYEETIRYFADLFQSDGSVMEILDADHTFVNRDLAAFYGLPVPADDAWHRLDGLRARGRGGILGMASALAKNSGASRTSPVLRGNWVSEVLLGEKLPRPPKNVPVLPEDETATDGLTVRQLVEKHREVAECAKCHDRIDPFGFALEEFDAIGRRRDKDLANRPIDARVELPDGSRFEGLDGLRGYLAGARRDDFVRQFCKKLLGFALGRSVQLSDEPLLDEMCERLADEDYRLSAAVESIVNSPQFQRIRGRDFVARE
jgi:hypothetical protein